jgi:hypothetical protein
VLRKALIKLGNKKAEEMQRQTRRSNDGLINSPFTPKKRKCSTEVQVLTEVRKKAKRKQVTEDTDSSDNSRSD